MARNVNAAPKASLVLRLSVEHCWAVQAEVTYEWLRGTKDDGGYNSASRLLMNKRKLRSTMVNMLDSCLEIALAADRIAVTECDQLLAVAVPSTSVLALFAL